MSEMCSFIQSSMQMSGCHKNATVLCSWVVVVVLQRNIDTWLWFCTTNRLTDRQTDRPTKEVTNHRLCDYTVEDVLMNTTFVKCVVKSKEAFIILIVHLNMKCNVWVCVCVDHSQVISIQQQHSISIQRPFHQPSTSQHISIECISNRIEC